MNWTRSLCTLTVASLLIQGSLLAWNHSIAKDATPADFKKDYPFSQDQGWYTEESYLLLKPSMENIWYGNKIKQVDVNLSKNHIKILDPEFQWSSGVRLSIGRYLPRHDGWDTSLTTAYLYSDADNKNKVAPNQLVGFNSSYSSGLPFNSGQFGWRLNYWTVDFSLGRSFQMTPHIVFHPYTGLRGSWQYQHTTSKVNATVPGTFITSKEKIGNDFWGVGPRFGTNFIYYFRNHFSLLANLAASLLVGGQHLKRDLNFDIITTQAVSRRIRSHDRLNVIRSNLEAMMGLGWETWVKNHTIRIAPSACLEGSLWFSMNQLYHIYNADSNFDNIETRCHGNLGLMGVSFNLQVDF